jgi:hypothetical protein
MHPRLPLATPLKTRSGYQITTPAGTDEVVVQLNNVEVLRITLGANMTIKTQGTLTLDANNIELKSGNNVSVKASNSLDLRASANVSLNGAAVNVNNGALEIS